LLGCFLSTGPNVNPIALGPLWLAYASNKIVNHVKSEGEVDTEAALSYTASALNTAKVVFYNILNTHHLVGV